MRVLTLSSLFPDASRPTFGVFVERQTRALAERCEVEVIAPVGLPPGPLRRHRRWRALSPLPAHENWNGLSVHRPHFLTVPGLEGRFAAASMARAVLPLARALHAERPFHIIDAEFFFPDGPAAMRLAAALGLPFSIKARGADIHHWGKVRRREVLAAGRAAYGLLAVSAAMKADMVALGLPADRIRVHYTGVDLDAFRPGDRAALKRELGIQGPLLVTLGALIPRKGQRLVVETLGELPGATLALIGDGPDGARLHGERVRVLGSLPPAEVARWLAAADVMVLPSASEGLANAWVEALACGTPIVIADAGGAREVVAGPAAGRIVAREPAAIAAAVRDLLENPPDPSAVRAHAQRFTWDANAEALHAHLSALF